MIPVYLGLLSLMLNTHSNKCGDTSTVHRPYGKIIRVVECEYIRDNIISVLEYKGETQHGTTIHYDSLWRIKDSSFFVNGKKNGDIVFFDTLARESGRITYKNGVRVGKEAFFFSPGHPERVKYYDKDGKEHGPWFEWWPNGNKRKELELSHGQLRNSLEFFPNGKPRLKYSVHFKKVSPILFDRKVSDMETWAPDGRSAGKVQKGAGEVLLFQLDEDKLIPEVILETYRDSLVKGVDVLDTLQAYRRLDSLKRIQSGK